jgi:hypothetical protein
MWESVSGERKHQVSPLYIYKKKSLPNVTCAKAFSNNGNQKSHMHAHTGEKP